MYPKQSWTRKTIQSFYDYALGLWNERCDALHGATVKENNEKRKQKIQEQVLSVYQKKEEICENFQYLFDEEFEVLCARSLQYLEKWLSTAALVDRRRGQEKRTGQERQRDG